jgi:hypothetical protein
VTIAVGEHRKTPKLEAAKRSTVDLKSEHTTDPNAEVGHCVHRIAMHRSHPGVVFMQKRLGRVSAAGLGVA